MANVSSSNGLEKRPKLRFPDFDESYKDTTLGEIASLVNRTDPKSDAPIMMLSAGNGFIMQSEKYSRDNAGQSLKKYILLKKGELAYNHGASKAKQYGCCYELTENEARIPYVYHCFKVCETEYTPYIAIALNNTKMDNQLKRLVSSSVRMDGLLNISFEDYMSITMSLPSSEEQKHIADFFSKLDERSKAQERLVSSLKKYKRGLLSAIFERRIRFKDDDGSKFPEWEQKKLISCCNGFDNLRQPITANLRRKGKYPYYGANGIQDYVDDYIFDGEYILLAEDGGHFDEFASKPIAQFISGRVWVNNHAHIIQAKQGYNNKYIFYCLEHKDIRKYINGSSRAKLNQEDMWDIPIPVPCLYEQEKIADFITAIDCSINDNVRQLETLQDLKTSLLQQLFI